MGESGRSRVAFNEKVLDGQIQQNQGVEWANTANAISKLALSTDASTQSSGRAVLLARSSTESRLVDRTAVDGDFSSGKTWSGLTGDSDGIYRIRANLVDKGTNASNLNMIVNGDTGANYERQDLLITGTSTGANNVVRNEMYLGRCMEQVPDFVEIYFPKNRYI